MTVLSELYSSGGTDVILHTLEIYADSWPERMYLVRDFVNHEAGTEDGRTVTFLASGIDIALPKRDASGAQNLTFAIDGVRAEATRLLRASISENEPVYLTYRCYLLSDLSGPAEAPLHFVVRSFQAEAHKVQVTAGLFDLIDMAWPRDVYNTKITPGLKYLQ